MMAYGLSIANNLNGVTYLYQFQKVVFMTICEIYHILSIVG